MLLVTAITFDGDTTQDTEPLWLNPSLVRELTSKSATATRITFMDGDVVNVLGTAADIAAKWDEAMRHLQLR